MNNRIVKGDTLEIYNENDTKVLSISEKIDSGIMHIIIDGEINSGVAHDFEDEIMAALSACNNIKLDLKQVPYICSLGMQVILSIQRIVDDISGASLRIYGVKEQVKEAFEDAGFFDILCIEETQKGDE